MTDALWGSERPDFIERIAKLAGGTTWREPMGGYNPSSDHLPDAHAIAAALAFGRMGPKDVGPDVAYCWALQNDCYRNKVVRLLSEALRCREFASVTTHRLLASEAVWDAMVWNRSSARPANAPRGYDRMLLTACGVLHRAAWDALAKAERCYRRDAA